MDDKPRYRRTAQQISEDKIRIAEMKLQAVRDAEEKRAEKKAENKKSKRKVLEPAIKKVSVVSESALVPKRAAREESPSPPPKSRKTCLYDSWFPS